MLLSLAIWLLMQFFFSCHKHSSLTQKIGKWRKIQLSRIDLRFELLHENQIPFIVHFIEKLLKILLYQNIIKFDVQVAEVLAVHPLQGGPDLLGHPLGRDLADPVVTHVGRQVA